MEEQKKPGMSKGCLVGLIVAGILLVIALLIVGLFWYYKEDLAKYATVAGLNQSKSHLAENPPAGVDTVTFNATVDAFVERLNAEEGTNLETLALALQAMQPAIGDDEITAEDVDLIYDAIGMYYPDMGQTSPEVERDEFDRIIDTTAGDLQTE